MSLSGKWFGFGTDADYDAAAQQFDRGQFAEAAAVFAKVAERNKDHALRQVARLHLADCYGRLLRESLAIKDEAAAIEWGLKATELNPKFPDLQLQLGRAYLLNQNFDEAERSAERALELNEKYAEAIILLAGIAAFRGKPWSELADQAFEINATLREPAAALLQRISEGDAQAWATLQAMTSAHSRDANLIAGEADDLARQKLFAPAALRYQKALELAPRYADIRCRYGQTLLEMDRVEAAVQEFEKALEINPRYAEAWAQLGIALRRERKDEEALKAFQRAVEIDPHHIIASQELRRHSWR